MRRIADYMTRQPWTVQLDDSLAVARRMLAEREIHHLPVLDAGRVVGIVTDRDIALAGERLGTVVGVMARVHCVPSRASLGDVLDEMTANRLDAVVVTEDDHVVGIFTASDALRVLSDLVRRRRAA